ncbi:sulfite exporter TauE/SafE family protein [Mangrovibacterium lignilyticum]|uniref:sulfite exporter TauE/SafE family protein n=1 Tax=Mangrovibacterium lignilyticum TaxID=2668052 RepID=UPI0019682ED4|nr:sulfite exporter TauE/SafE family protein [Mangrovibacterium lignilyticum]
MEKAGLSSAFFFTFTPPKQTTMDFLLSDLSWYQITLLALCAMLSGMSKVGVPGVSMIVVPILAIIFGGKQSTGVLLPILMMADLFGVLYYRRHAQWSYVLKIVPWAFIGIGLALWVGEVVNDEQFKNIIAILVFLCIGLMLWQDRKRGKQFFPDRWWFAASMGILGGFATMIGNVAGPIFAIYLLAMHLPKNSFIGTSAWFFLIVNYCKFPLHIFIWKTISWQSLALDFCTLPAIALGAFLGIKLVKVLPEKIYRTAVIVLTALSAFLLLV